MHMKDETEFTSASSVVLLYAVHYLLDIVCREIDVPLKKNVGALSIEVSRLIYILETPKKT